MAVDREFVNIFWSLNSCFVSLWLPLRRPWLPFGPFGVPWGFFWLPLGVPWGGFGSLWGVSGRLWDPGNLGLPGLPLESPYLWTAFPEQMFLKYRTCAQNEAFWNSPAAILRNPGATFYIVDLGGHTVELAHLSLDDVI